MDKHPPLPAQMLAALDEAPQTSALDRLAAAFQAVYGQDGRGGRSSDQRLVMKHLRKACCMDQPVFVTVDGVCDVHAAAQRDGARTWGLIVERYLEIARREPVENKPKLRVKR